MVVEATTVRQVPDPQKQQIDIAWQTGATDAASCLSFDEIHWNSTTSCPLRLRLDATIKEALLPARRAGTVYFCRNCLLIFSAAPISNR